MSPVGHLVFKTSEALHKRLVGSTPTSSARPSALPAPLQMCLRGEHVRLFYTTSERLVESY